MATKITLPTIWQLERPYVTDRELSTGAFATKITLNGQEVNGGYAFSSTVGNATDGGIKICDYYGLINHRKVGLSNLIVRPRFEHVTREGEGCIKENFEIIEDVLHVDGKPVYWGAERIDIVEELENINLKLPSNENTGFFERKGNEKFKLQENQCVKVKLADGTVDYAEKIVGVIRGCDEKLTYNDGTEVIDGGTAYHRLRPMPAKEVDGGIQTGAGMASKFDVQNLFLFKKGKACGDLSVTIYDVRYALNAMTHAFIKSAEVMAELQKNDKLTSPTIGKPNTVNELFDQLLAGTIDEDGLRAGLKQLVNVLRNKKDVKIQDVTALENEINQASETYIKKRETKNHLASCFICVDSAIDNLKL